nr:putative ribonuclease H-like domain-containing protein [Tanacetum cinerariifolium]
IKFCEKIRVLEFSVECKTIRIENLTNELDTLKKEKEGLESKLTGLPEFADDTITDYTKPSPSVESNPNDLQNSSSSASENGESTGGILSKLEIKFVRPADSPTVAKSDKKETVRKPSIKYSELYRKPTKRKFPTVNRKLPTGNTKFSTADMGNKGKAIKASTCWIWKPSQNLSNKGNISYLSNYEPFDGGYVSFGKEDARLLAKEQSKQNSVLFTDLECIVLGRDFKLIDDTNVLLRTPRQHNMYSIDLKNIVPHKDLTCLVAKASANECMLWHRRLGYLNYKTMNKLVRHNLVRGLPTKCFENDHNCTGCLKEKQHKASFKSKLVNSVTKPLHTLYMDLFGPTSISSISHKWYCLVVIDNFSRFTWTFFLKTKDKTSSILRNFITEIENIKELKVKIIRFDNGGEFRNKEMNDFCSMKGIKREFSNARTPQQNGVAKRRNRTLIEAARTMLADAKLSVTFWAEAVNTTCTNSTNLSGTKDATSQEVKKDVSSLRYIVLLNWFHDSLLESPSSNAQDTYKADAPESSGNPNPTASTSNPPDDQMETLTVETPIPTVSSPIPTACFEDSTEPTTTTRIISKRVTIDSHGEEADVSNMETTIIASPTPTLRIHKDHPNSQIIVYHMDVKSAFLYGTIDEEVYVMKPPGF